MLNGRPLDVNKSVAGPSWQSPSIDDKSPKLLASPVPSISVDQCSPLKVDDDWVDTESDEDEGNFRSKRSSVTEKQLVAEDTPVSRFFIIFTHYYSCHLILSTLIINLFHLDC